MVMQTHILPLPVVRRRKSRTHRIKQMIIAAVPIAAAKKAVPDSAKAKAAGAGGIAVATAAIAGAAYKLRGRSGDPGRDDSARFAANNAGPVTPPSTPTV
jgi:hypothetical protein